MAEKFHLVRASAQSRKLIAFISDRRPTGEYRLNREVSIKTLEANNIKLDRPYTVNDSGVGIAFITDPWGTYIEINERPPQ